MKAKTAVCKKSKMVLLTLLECILLFTAFSYFPNVFIRWAYDIPNVSFWGNRSDIQAVTEFLRQDFAEQRKTEPTLIRSAASLSGNEWDLSYYSERNWSSDSELGTKNVSCSGAEREQIMRAADAVLEKDEKALFMGADAKTAWLSGSDYALVYSKNGLNPKDTCCFKEGESVYSYRLSIHWFICREYKPSTGRDVLCFLAKCVPWLAVAALPGLKFSVRRLMISLDCISCLRF